ncbi:MAG: ribose-phosphate pyrophosphokinase [candidate division WOR-3 bacterium]|nr:ribose-phosphate pyrophosphokinase [candidate division WOR-3 bacterium]MCX7948235.1 ribose-phosphate pyrophosphokinase [candidate division WOR-3 bacterium]MDW8150037.1 ribose-phosphate pyrophosphokinase [candidate division WOR-3 bacterium]
MENLKIISGNASKQLLKEICDYLKITSTPSIVDRFSDGEIMVKILESIRGYDVFVVQSTNPPSDNLMELLLILDAVKRASANRITAVIPYFGYSRQDRKDTPRVPISARLVSDLIQIAGAGRVLTIDLHAEQIQGFFNIPVDNLYAIPVFKDYLLKQYSYIDADSFVIVSPDAGGARRARLFANKLGDLPIALIDKRRPFPNQAEIMNVIGDVYNKIAIVVDDIIDTGRTISIASKALSDRGAKEVIVFATHGIFSSNAKEILENSPIKEIVITNTIEGNEDRIPRNARKISIAPLISEAILRIYSSESVSSLFI